MRLMIVGEVKEGQSKRLFQSEKKAERRGKNGENERSKKEGKAAFDETRS